MGFPELPDEWTYRPSWLPPWGLPHGWPIPLIFKKDVLEAPRKPYYFFDTPDSEDCFKKIYNFMGYGLRTAAIVSTLDLISNKQPTYPKAFGRVATHFGRIGGSFMLYAAVTCASANILGENKAGQVFNKGEINHAIGGASIGLIWGYKFHSTAVGAGVAAAAALLGTLYKRSHDQGWQVMPPEHMSHTREENGTLGGQNYGDWRVGVKLGDPGRKSLE